MSKEKAQDFLEKKKAEAKAKQQVWLNTDESARAKPVLKRTSGKKENLTEVVRLKSR